MTEKDKPRKDVVDLLSDLGANQVQGTPVRQGDTTLVPVMHVREGWGFGRAKGDDGGGAGLDARPVGAWSINGKGEVNWHPAVNVNRVVLGGQLALAAALAALAFALRRRR
ncbi:hypothetical protein [Saccharopolyspora taberi]|uniref:Sporulation protein YtfJ (Spore_YtfJ) n=1 Tax=Saccharopolyspora taberi TaxID=60895 RepID=A0ABN3VJF4_9PSEU